MEFIVGENPPRSIFTKTKTLYIPNMVYFKYLSLFIFII